MPDLPTSLTAPTERLRAVEAAVVALRRGMPAILGGEVDLPLALLAVETADLAGLAALDRTATGPRLLLLAPDRARALMTALPTPESPVALDATGLTLEEVRVLADPTHRPIGEPPLLTAAPAPASAQSALALAVLARLLPALLCAPALGRVGPDPADVMRHAELSASALVRVSEAYVPLEDAPDTRMIAFRSSDTGAEHYAVLVGRPELSAAPLVRVHSECFSGDLFGSLRCDCGPQLRGAIRRMAGEGAGALLYMAQEGRGIGLPNKLRAYALQDRGLDTVDANRALGFAADERDFQVAAAILRDLGLVRVRLLTNNPDKVAALAAHGIDVAARESLLFAGNGVNDHYLQTKATRFRHML